MNEEVVGSENMWITIGYRSEVVKYTEFKEAHTWEFFPESYT